MLLQRSRTEPAASGAEPDWASGLVKRWAVSGWRVPVVEFFHVLQAQLDRVSEDSERRAFIIARMKRAHSTAEAHSTPATWYSGSNMDVVWRELHLAEVEICRLLPDDELAGNLPRYLERATERLGRHHEQVVELRKVAKEILEAGEDVAITKRQRSVVVSTVSRMNEKSSAEHNAVRSVRNRLMQFGLLLLGLNLIIAVVGSGNPGLLPLCVKGAELSVCPAGEAAAAGIDIWWLQLFGALGGAVGIVTLIHRTEPSVVPYTLAPHQGVIKILLGAVLAMLGVLALSSDAIDLSVSTQAELLIFAAILGYSQQAGTRLLDSYANKVVKAAQPPGTT